MFGYFFPANGEEWVLFVAAATGVCGLSTVASSLCCFEFPLCLCCLVAEPMLLIIKLELVFCLSQLLACCPSWCLNLYRKIQNVHLNPWSVSITY